MKRSELSTHIKEMIVDVLQEATIETSPEDLAKVKASADKDDVIKVTEEDKEPTSVFQEDRKRAAELTKDRLANRKNKADFDRSFEGTKDRDEDKEPTAKDIEKNDLVSTISLKLQATTKEMKTIVNKWKEAEGEEKERLLVRLKDLTKIKKELEGLI